MLIYVLCILCCHYLSCSFSGHQKYISAALIVHLDFEIFAYPHTLTVYTIKIVIPNLGVWVPPELFDKDGRGDIGGGGTGGSGLVLCDVPLYDKSVA